MSMRLLVQVSELMQAAAKMNDALENYREATGNVKTAAADLAGKWEGAAKEAFVNDQENAYRWYISMADVVMMIIMEARRCADLYQKAEEKISSMLNV